MGKSIKNDINEIKTLLSDWKARSKSSKKNNRTNFKQLKNKLKLIQSNKEKLLVAKMLRKY